MQSPAEALVNYLGIGDLSFGLEPRQRRALLIISALPAILVIAALTQLAYEIDVDSFSYNESRVHRLSFLVQSPAAYVGLAVMMIAGIGSISRSEGSYCFVGAIVFAGLALVFGVYGSVVWTLVDVREFETVRDLHPDIALKFASFAGLVAAGYAFLAFRGLAPRDGE